MSYGSVVRHRTANDFHLELAAVGQSWVPYLIMGVQRADSKLVPGSADVLACQMVVFGSNDFLFPNSISSLSSSFSSPDTSHFLLYITLFSLTHLYIHYEPKAIAKCYILDSKRYTTTDSWPASTHVAIRVPVDKHISDLIHYSALSGKHENAGSTGLTHGYETAHFRERFTTYGHMRDPSVNNEHTSPVSTILTSNQPQRPQALEDLQSCIIGSKCRSSVNEIRPRPRATLVMHEDSFTRMVFPRPKVN